MLSRTLDMLYNIVYNGQQGVLSFDFRAHFFNWLLFDDFFPNFFNRQNDSKEDYFQKFQARLFFEFTFIQGCFIFDREQGIVVEGLCVFCIEKLALIGVAVIYVDIFSFLIPERSKRFTVFLRGGNLSRKTSYPYFSCIISFLFSQLFFLKQFLQNFLSMFSSKYVHRHKNFLFILFRRKFRARNTC